MPATELVHIPTPTGTVAGHLALPDGRGPYPGVVVLHEIFGLTDDIRGIAGRFAAEGYAALAPDLYSAGPSPLCLSRLLLAGSLTRFEAEVLDQVDAARHHLAGRPEVDGDRLAIIGFCMGGGFALGFAARRGGLRAAAVNYGQVPKDRAALASVCPVVASYGGRDRVFAPMASRLEAHLDALGVPHDVRVYESAGHSFMNHHDHVLARLPSPLRPGHDAEAADDAWRRILTFFAEHVGAGGE